MTSVAPAASAFADLKRFVRFGADDARRLAAFGPVAAPHFERIAEVFYARAREHEDARRVLRGDAQVARLRRALVRWLGQLCTGPHDEAYYREHAAAGRAHVRAGLPERYVLVAITVLRTELGAVADAALPAAEARAVRAALGRALDLELAVVLDAYADDRAARLARRPPDEPRTPRERRHADAVELAPVLIVGLDPAGHIAMFNREAERVTGFARDEAIGQAFDALLLPEDLRAAEGARLRRALHAPDVAAAAAEPGEAWEVPLRTCSGRGCLVRWHLARAVDPEAPGDVVVIATGRDVTDERALLERTLQSERLAAVGRLAAGLAHEVRNPLNGALLNVTYVERALGRAGAGHEARDAAAHIAREIDRLSDLVRDFLVFARPTPPQPEPTTLVALCERTLGQIAAEAQAARVALRLDAPAGELVLALDAARMEQALLNLLRNAVEAVAGDGAPDGHVVTLRVRRRPRQVVLEVEDDGPGLPGPDAPIFDVFYSTKPHGTGLGLAIVHRAVTDHDGSIEVESRPGRTVFRVVLPAPDGPSTGHA